MSSKAPIHSPARPTIEPVPHAASSCSRVDKWRPTSVPMNMARMSNIVRGLLNKLTSANFETIASRVAGIAIAVERSDDEELLHAFARRIFTRGVAEPGRQNIYAPLCRRIIEGLEEERNSLRRADLYHSAGLDRTFEVAIRVLAADEFQRVGTEAPRELPHLMTFLAELLIHGTLLLGDIEAPLAVLFDSAQNSDADMAVALCRFFARILPAFNAYHILNSLHASIHVERVLRVGTLSSMVRYLMMRTLDQILLRQPSDAFRSDRERIEVYGLYSDDGDDDDGPEESDVDAEDDEYIQTSCQDWAHNFLAQRSLDHLADVLHSLQPQHRLCLLRTLISSAIHSSDIDTASTVGSLYISPKIEQLCQSGESSLFLRSLISELELLPDTLLDVPDACRLWAYVLQCTEVERDTIEELVSQTIPDKLIRERLVTELRHVQRELSYGVDGEDRTNRFERRSSKGSCSGSNRAHAI